MISPAFDRIEVGKVERIEGKKVEERGCNIDKAAAFHQPRFDGAVIPALATPRMHDLAVHQIDHRDYFHDKVTGRLATL